MSKVITFDPFERMPFQGYIEQDTGRQAQYLSLAHFIHSERFRGVDDHYRGYLLRLDDMELFQLEVEGIGQTSSDCEDWVRNKQRLIYAGIFMQAVANRERYVELLSPGVALSVAACSYSDDLAEAMGAFIHDVSATQDKLKVAFVGACTDMDFTRACLNVIFAKRLPQCLFAIEDDPCSMSISRYARESATAFSLLDAALSAEAIADNLARRATHVFQFVGDGSSLLSTEAAGLAARAGLVITPIQPKP